jgi:hypothetical protein
MNMQIDAKDYPNAPPVVLELFRLLPTPNGRESFDIDKQAKWLEAVKTCIAVAYEGNPDAIRIVRTGRSNLDF